MTLSLGDGSVYRVIGGALCYMKADRNDLVIPVKLANFSARIVEDQILDDGAVEERRYRIAGALADGFALPTITVPVDKFAGTGWVERGWGASAIVAAGAGTSMITTAIKTVSVARERRIYAHLGWLQLYDEWVYLHAGGAIGANGPVAGIDVEIGGELAHMELLAPRDEQEAVRAALEMLRMGDIGCVVACAAWRAPTAAFLQVTVSPFLVGPTGVFKSAVLGLGQAMWGPRWDGTRFPANWSGTVNANEKMAYAAKDAFLIIDDFNPHGTRTEIAAKHADADRLLRAQGNLGGRARMRPDTSLRPEYVPRGMIGSSGEDLPWGASLRARLYPVRIKQGDIDKGQLTAMQAAAADGLLAEAMAGYVRYLAPCCDVLPEKLRKRRSEIRDELVVGHARTPDNVASLIIGLELFLGYACNIGAISREEVLPFRSGGIEVLKRRAAAQANEQHEADPVIQFMDSTQAMLASGGAHLRSPDGERPINPEQCGWRKTGETDSMTGEPRDAWVPQGKHIGWFDGGDTVWLLPSITLGEVNRVLVNATGQTIGRTEQTLWSAFADAGKLTKTGTRNTLKKSFGGKQLRVLWVKAGEIIEPAVCGSNHSNPLARY